MLKEQPTIPVASASRVSGVPRPVLSYSSFLIPKAIVAAHPAQGSPVAWVTAAENPRPTTIWEALSDWVQADTSSNNNAKRDIGKLPKNNG